MRTIELQLYKFEELSSEAKEKALNHFRDREYSWFDEAKQTMREFAELFGVRITSYELGYGRGTHIRFSTGSMLEEGAAELSGVRAFKWINNNIDEKFWNEGAKNGSCPLTGVCFDCNVLDPLVDFMKQPSDKTIEELIQDCFDSLEDAVSEDVLYHYGDEATKEHIEANDYEFTEEGDLH